VKNGIVLILEYKVNLLKMNGIGEFPCSKCGLTISPDDETDDTYLIVEQKTRRGVLEELIIQCNQCKSLVRLTGFLLFEKLK
jgi:hypothetical protein